ncbi:MAG: TolC family protein [Bacteroidota bacterium]|nr:TolC family protein [Bacteroidota bacterium]
MFKNYFVVGFVLTVSATIAQDTLTLNEAIDIALQNNFDIRIAKNNLTAAKQNNTLGVAGGLPSVSANVSDNQAYNNIYQKLATGQEIQRNNASVNSLNGGINATYTLFNGFRVYVTKNRLNELEKQNESVVLNQIQNTVALVMSNYYNALTQQQYSKVTSINEAIADIRLGLVNNRKFVGMASDLDYLQAQLDLSTAIQNTNSQKLTVNQVKIDLVTIINSKSKFSDFNLKDSIEIDTTLKLGMVLDHLEKNPQILIAESQLKINQQVLKEINKQNIPIIRLNAGYNISNVQSDAGLLITQRSFGPSVGASILIPIYNGGIINKQKSSAEINVQNAQLQKESIFNTLESGAIKTYQAYSNAINQIKSQNGSIDLSKKLLDLTINKYKLNQATVVEMRLAQANYENALYRLYSLQYQAKIAEIELKRLSGQLVK